jgi:hypothetical protein
VILNEVVLMLKMTLSGFCAIGFFLQRGCGKLSELKLNDCFQKLAALL